jgi:N-acetylglucosaminyldiphosphoundecaprenol N-acetyl-beta-D-mannosaminyltransferase
VAICAGAVIDFMAEEKNRAPEWVQMLCLEWLHRMLLDPRRLVKRYAVDALFFPKVLAKEIKSRALHR